MKRHPFDLVSFVPGVLAVTIALVALGGGLTIDLLATDWVWPAVLVGLGLVVLASAGIGRRAPTPADEPGVADVDAAAAADEPAVPDEPTPADDRGEEWPAG